MTPPGEAFETKADAIALSLARYPREEVLVVLDEVAEALIDDDDEDADLTEIAIAAILICYDRLGVGRA